jgi:two-component system sensor histidine kinase HydH
MQCLSLSPALPSVRIDAERLRQVLINLIQNALQAIELSGTLRVETALREAADFEGIRRTWVDIDVADTGPGVPQQVLANLFQPFVTTRQRGTGLGLAISQRIVRSAGGEILVRTRENYGSTFTVRLPVTPGESFVEESPQTQSAEAPSEASGALDTPSSIGTKR